MKQFSHFRFFLQLTSDDDVPTVQTDRRSLLLYSSRLQMVYLGGESLFLLFSQISRGKLKIRP